MNGWVNGWGGKGRVYEDYEVGGQISDVFYFAGKSFFLFMM
jgi:hypothetical protein